MSLKVAFEIDGRYDGEPLRAVSYGHENGLTQLDVAQRARTDPEDRPGMQPPEDTSQSGGLSDPEDRPGMQPPEDTGGSRFAPSLDDNPGRGSSTPHFGGSCRDAAGHDRRPIEVGLLPETQRYSGFIILRLADLVPVEAPTGRDSNVLVELAHDLGLGGLLKVLDRFGTPASSRAITTRNATAYGCGSVTLDGLERRAASSELAPRHSLWSYFRLDGRGLEIFDNRRDAVTSASGVPYSEAEVADLLVEQLNALSVVDLAYRELAASDPSPGEHPAPHIATASAEELTDFQIYLGQFGIDALWAQDQIGTGNGFRKIGLADLEQGWITDHDEISEALTDDSLRHGDNRHDSPSYRGNHGTAVVGQLVAEASNEIGIVGIVGDCARISLASHYLRVDPTNEGVLGETDATPSNGHVADAITALLTGAEPKLGAGDVLLLEVQRGGQPTEIDPLDFAAIQLASASGVIVIEAAGNGGLDLDRLRAVDGRSLDRNNPRFRDSGAIMVGAGRPRAPHERALFSNFGSRLDCFGWGDGVVSAGYGDYLSGDDRSIYTDSFSGTSSAAPMIAGAAVLVQHIYRANAAPQGIDDDSDPETWRRLSPRQMRALLSNPQTGTSQSQRVGGFIGVMPNLRFVLDEALGIVPRVYLRDHTGDSGELPYKRRECASPDIIVSRSKGGVQRLHVKLRNRGLKAAREARATIYGAPISTLVTPDRWRFIGRTPRTVSVPQGDTPVSTENIPAPGLDDRSCLVAVAEYAGCPEPLTPCHGHLLDWQAFLTSMRARGNVALRNAHDHSDPSQALDFHVNGAPDAPRAFELQVIQRLPEGVTVHLEAQLGLALKFSRGRLWTASKSDDDTAKLYLPRQPRFRLGVVTLPPAVDFPCRFELDGADRVEAGHSLSVRQLYRGQEVGRITWRFCPE